MGERNQEEQRYFDEFFTEVYTELERKYGPVDEMHVCENIGEHMVGNVSFKKNFFNSKLFRLISSLHMKKTRKRLKLIWIIDGKSSFK